jgi:putative endonuclease
MRAKDALGRYGEELAVRHLERLGLAVLDRNWRCKHGEIDIVARDGSTLVICEVKTRSSTAFGSPIEAVTPYKMKRLRRLAMLWLDEHEVHLPGIRIDVVGIIRPVDGQPSLTHLRGVA